MNKIKTYIHISVYSMVYNRKYNDRRKKGVRIACGARRNHGYIYILSYSCTATDVEPRQLTSSHDRKGSTEQKKSCLV